MMRFVLLLVLCVGFLSAQFCSKKAAERADTDYILDKAEEVAKSILSPCAGLTDAFFNPSNGCTNLITEGYCYYFIARERSEKEGKVDFTTIKNGIPDVAKLAKMGCNNKCYGNMKDKVIQCFQDVNARAQIIENLEGRFDQVTEFLQNRQSNAPDSAFSQFIGLGLSRFTKLEDIVELVREKSDIIKDNYFEMKAQLGKFCDAKCYQDSKTHLVKLASRLNKNKKCIEPTTFCGGCANAARSFLSNNGMPCCLADLYKFAMGKADAAYAAAQASDSELAKFSAKHALENPQYQCVREVMDEHTGSLMCAA